MNKIIILLAILLLVSCKGRKEQTFKGSKSSTEAISKDTLFTFELDRLYFFATKRNIADIMIVGVTHDNPGLGVGVDTAVVKNYEFFWDLYFENTGKNPRDLKIGIENGIPANMPQAQIGGVILLSKPQGFITPYLFNLGLQKIVITDPRDKSAKNTERFIWGLDLFMKRGGVVNIDTTNTAGFPVARVQREPVLTYEDIKWLKDVWYKNCHLQNEAYEKLTYDFARKGAMSVVGAVHALRLHRKYDVGIALIVTETDLNEVTRSITEIDYLVKLIE